MRFDKLIEMGVAALVLLMLIVALWFMPLLTVIAAGSVVAAELIVLFVRARKAKRWKPTTTFEVGFAEELKGMTGITCYDRGVRSERSKTTPPWIKGLSSCGSHAFLKKAISATDTTIETIELAPFQVDDVLSVDAGGEFMQILTMYGPELSVRRAVGKEKAAAIPIGSGLRSMGNFPAGINNLEDCSDGN